MPLPTDCPADCGFAAWRWARRWFGDCVCSSRDAASFALGLVSVFAWGVAELPQIVANFRNGATDGVSFAFIATWLTGDALNLVGCAVSPTLPTQLYTAIVYTSTTVVLIAQHVAYERRGAQTAKADAVASTAADPLDAPLEARLLEDPDPGRTTRASSRTATTTTRGVRVPADVEASGGLDADDADAAGRPALRRRNSHTEYLAPRRESGGARSLSSARTFAFSSGSWTGSTGINTNDAAAHARGRSRSEQARRRSVGSGSAAVGALAAALGVAACVAVVAVRGPGNAASDMDGGGDGGGGGRDLSASESPRFASDVGDFSRDELPRLGAFSRLASSAVASEDSGASPRGDDSGGGDAPDPSDASARAPLVPAPAWVGQALGWSMTAIYLGGRVPQILLNHKRGSVEGLSVSMFALAVLGNLTYGSSILARSTRWTRVRPNLPWLCDAALCLAMDAVILWQYARFVAVSGEARDARGGDGGDGGDDDSGGERNAAEATAAARLDPIGIRGDARPMTDKGSRSRLHGPRESLRTDGGEPYRAGYVALSASEGSETWETFS